MKAMHSGLAVTASAWALVLGLLPLAYGIGAGAGMLRPLAIAVIGALCISVLVATPVSYLLMAPRELTPPEPKSTSLR